VPLLAALVAAGLAAAAPDLPGGPGEARIDSGSATLDVATGTYRLEGGVVISRGVVRLRAPTARWDPRTGTVDASGGVLLTDATRVIAADGLHAVLDGDFEASGVVAFLKAGPTDLTSAADREAAAACGRNALTVQAQRVSGAEHGPLRLGGARITTCDCPERGAPPWELRSSAAVVHPGERVELSWPVLWITPSFLLIDRPVPVLIFPWLSLPLGRRVSGLLPTELGLAGATGVSVAQPLYLTLGESADLTVTPRYDIGRKRSEVAKGDPAVRGPGGSLELRWTPAPGVAGRLQADALWDLDDQVGPLQGANGAQGLRLALRGDWSQRFGDRTDLRVDLDAVGDPLYVRDFTSDVLQSGATVRRSAVVLSRRGDDVVVEGSAAYLEPVASDGSLALVPSGLFELRLPAFHRWPAVSAWLLPVHVLGPVVLSGSGGLARFAPVTGATSDGVRLAATRLDSRLELAAPFSVGELLAVRPFLRGAGLGYLFDASAKPVTSAWALVGVTLSTELSRRFGEVRHLVQPRLEWRLLGAAQGGVLPAAGYDGLDRTGRAPRPKSPFAGAAPPGAEHQVSASIASSLWKGGQELARAELGQGFDLRRGALAEGWFQATSGAGPFTGEANLRFWTGGRPSAAPPTHAVFLDAFSELLLRVALADGRGDELHGGLLAIGAGGSGRLGAGVDELFDPRFGAIDARASATLGTKLRLGPATFGYDALLPGRPAAVASCKADGTTRQVGTWQIQQQSGSVEWDSPCHCLRARLSVSLDACGNFGGGLVFDLGRTESTSTH
jgi:LPS-assembly protein